jgi:hypothetical protein
VEPMMRALPDAEAAAAILGRALAAAAEVPVRPVPEAEADRAVTPRPAEATA